MRALLIAGLLGLASVVLAQPFDTTWTSRIDYNRSDYGYAIARSLSGGFVVTGVTRPVSESATAYIQLISSNGEIGFNHIYNEDDGLGGFRDIISTNDNGYIAAGRGDSGSDFVVVRLDSLGGIEWIFESPFSEGFMMEAQILQTINNQILVVETGSGTSFGDNHLIMLSSSGDTLWTRTYGGPGLELMMEAFDLEGGGFCFYGSQNYPISPSLCANVLRTDSSGIEIWNRQYIFDDRTIWTSWGAPIGNSGHIIGGYLEDSNYQTCIFAMRLDADGEVIWQTDFDCQYQGATYCGGKISDDEFVICGYHQGIPFLIAFNAEEDVLWYQSYPELDASVPLDLKVLDANSIVMTGYTTDADNYDIYVVSMDRPDALAEIPCPNTNSFQLAPCYPNPFNASTTISFSLDRPGLVQLKVFDITGREVSRLVDESMTAGAHDVLFDGAGLASGIYFYSLQAGNQQMTKKMVLIR